MGRSRRISRLAFSLNDDFLFFSPPTAFAVNTPASLIGPILLAVVVPLMRKPCWRLRRLLLLLFLVLYSFLFFSFTTWYGSNVFLFSASLFVVVLFQRTSSADIH